MNSWIKNTLGCMLIGLVFTSCITINHAQGPTAPPAYIDPVCGARIDTSKAPETQYKNHVYYFESEECQKIFLKNPDRFAHNYYYTDNEIPRERVVTGAAVLFAVWIAAMSSMMIFGHWR